jgi:hypothetical protein
VLISCQVSRAPPGDSPSASARARNWAKVRLLPSSSTTATACGDARACLLTASTIELHPMTMGGSEARGIPVQKYRDRRYGSSTAFKPRGLDVQENTEFTGKRM